MGAIGAHKTATSTGGWDGPANEARLKSGESAAYYRRAYAWQDPDGDETVKSTYRFVHHEVSGDGTPGAANVRACQTGIGVLNGGRGGSTIPSGDRRGVYNHLAAHLRDADVEPPDLRSERGDAETRGPGDAGMGRGKMIERRDYTIEGLAVDETEAPHIRGYAAVFDAESQPLMEMGGQTFVERVAPGAFAGSIEGGDVRALWNHDPNYVLGRTTAETLRLDEDEHGLSVDILPPDTSWARDLMTSMRRGDVNQMSFGFQVVRDEWATEKMDDQVRNVRTLLEVRLYDVSPVTFPAYPQTSVGVRSFGDVVQDALQVRREEIERAAVAAEAQRAAMQGRAAQRERELELILRK